MSAERAPASDVRPPPRWGGWRMLALVVLCAIWGSTWLVIRVGLEADLPPLTAAAVRFAIAAAAMVLVSARLARREGGAHPPLWLSATLGVTNFAVSYGIVYLVEERLPSGLVALLWGTYPLVMAAVGHFALPEERLRPAQVAGFALGFLGLAALFVFDLHGGIGVDGLRYGALLLVSPVSVALGTAVIKRHGSRYSSLRMNRDGLAVGAILLALWAWAVEGWPHGLAPAPLAWFSLLYLSLFGTVVTFGLYFWLLRAMPANQLSLIAYVTPALALFLGAVVAGERVAASTVLGAVLILLGVALAKRRS